jgi:NADPH2:quinone reductase
MRAIEVLRTGGPSVLTLAEVADPVAGDGQVVVEVAYAGVNFADVVMRRGEAMTAPPFVPGVEGSGRVVALGPGADPALLGRRVSWAPVAGASAIGSYAERLALRAEQLLPLPDDVSLRDAAALTLQGLTAHYLATEQVTIGPGTSVLVHAGAGGTGRLLVQWAKHLGATVFVTVGSPVKAEVARAAGADHAICYRDTDFAEEVLRLTGGRGVDYIADAVGAGTFRGDLRAAAVRGRVCVFGRAAGMPEQLSPLELFPKSLTVSGGNMTNFLRTRDEVLRKAGELWQAVRDGWLHQQLHSVRPLAEAAVAHDALESRGTTGKLLLELAGG